MDETPASRFDLALDVPWELLEYERWVATEARASRDDYLFAEARARFEAWDEDVVRVPGELEVHAKGGTCTVSSRQLGGGVPVEGVARSALERVLGLIDGTRTLAELRVLSGADRPALEQLVRRALGRLLFVPDAVAALEAKISGAELVRFPGAPYELVRAYWHNMAAVRRAAETWLADFEHDPLRWLRRLHVLALLGPELATFYRPASRITDGGVRPGALYTTPSRRLATPSGTLLLGGPRVGVGLVGGARYQRLVATHAGDPASLEPDRELVDADGLSWGSVLHGRAVDDKEDSAWFCPPRPVRAEHFEKLFSAYRSARRAAEAGDATATVRDLARFHHRFVRLHPFRCANQSLSMNLVNGVLARSHGAGIPHLILDQLALRLDAEAYARVFALAVAEHLVTGEPVERWRVLLARKAAAYAFIERVRAARTDDEAESFAAEAPEAARAALVLA